MATKKNLLDALAKPATAKSAKSNKIAAEVNPDISSTVDLLIADKAMIKSLEAEIEIKSEKIRSHVFTQQAKHARDGNYSKTFDVKGITGNITYVASDRWTLPKEEAVQDELKKLIGSKRFDEWFETRRTVTLKQQASENAELIAALSTAAEKAGFSLADIFDVTDVLKSKKDLDESQFELEDEKLYEFRTLAKQYKPGLK